MARPPPQNSTARPYPAVVASLSSLRASPRHANAGFMARKEETDAGMGDMSSSHRVAVYGEQVWNYFVRSYPDIVASHYPDAV